MVMPEISAASERPVLVNAGALLFVQGVRMWRSDGTTAGTVLLGMHSASNVIALGDRYYFVRNESSSYALWSTDGTAAGTSFVKALPTWTLAFWRVAGKLYFSVETPNLGWEPWVSDGTADGTHMLVNLNAEPAASSFPANLTAAGNLVYFVANDPTRNTRQLFRSDGTSAGTIRLTTLGDTWNSPHFSLFAGWNGSLYFHEIYAKLWKSDGTVAGTNLLKTFGNGGASQLFPASSLLYITADDGNGDRPWRSDGTAAGTIDLEPGTYYGGNLYGPGSYGELAGRVYMSSDAGIFLLGSAPGDWKRVRTIGANDSFLHPFTPGAGALLFSLSTPDHGIELWKTDGTADGTVLVKDIRPGTESAGVSFLEAAGPYLFFKADDGVHGKELWRTDGTEAGTILLADIVAGAAGADPVGFTAVGNLLYFIVPTSDSSGALWRSDGTPAGTRKVANLPRTTTDMEMWGIDGTLYFAADDGVHGMELWKTTGIDSVAMVADLEPGSGSSNPDDVVRAGNFVYFSASTTATGRELWAIALTGASTSTLSIRDLRLNEGQNGSIIVTRGGDTAGAASVMYTTLNASAQAGSDYTPQSGIVAFAAGETAKPIAVAALTDSAVENDESFLVMLSSPSGAILSRTTGTVVIHDDDRRAELKVEWVPSTSSQGRRRLFRITNEGPSTATELAVRFHESPGIASIDTSLCLDEDVYSNCDVHELMPGQSAIFTADIMGEGYTNPVLPPGQTIYASATARELDTNPADNSVTKMLSANGIIAMPSFLTTGAAATADITWAFPMWRDELAKLASSNPNVTVTPDSLVVPQGQQTSRFTLTASAAGATLLTLYQNENSVAKMNVGIAAPGSTAKLDVAIVETSAHVAYGQTATLAARISASRPDGTKPTGTVTLLDSNGNVLAIKSLDGDASASFTRSGLEPGTHWYTFNYSGDASFNALAGASVFAQVRNWSTETTVELPPMVCGATDIVVYVKSPDTMQAPAGTVRITVGNQIVGSAPLQACCGAGQARAVYRHTFAINDYYVSVSYQPAGTFSQSGDGIHFLSGGACVAMSAQATYIGAEQIRVTWSPVAGAHHYEVLQGYNATNWNLAGSTAGTSLVDDWVSADKSYLYTVRAMDAANNVLAYSFPDLVTTVAFTDDPLVAGSTRVRGAHIRQAELATLALETFGVNTLLQPTLGTIGTGIQAHHITGLRTRINAARAKLGLPPHPFTGTPAAGTFIRATHLQELRNAVK